MATAAAPPSRSQAHKYPQHKVIRAMAVEDVGPDSWRPEQQAVIYSTGTPLGNLSGTGIAGVNYLAPPSGSQTFSASSLVRK